MENEKRLIDANALNLKLKKMEELMRLGDIGEIDINLLIASMPTEDAVPVVYCKHCCKCTGDKWCKLMAMYVKDDDFCSYGERKDNA